LFAPLARAVLAEPSCAENAPSVAHELLAHHQLQACSLMSRRKHAFDSKRILTAAEAAAYLGRSATWLARHSARLQEAGFPQPLPVVGGYDKMAIDNWLDRLGDNAINVSFEEAWNRATHG
jgi:predicted DNA-binding transcriptional regulator AlpA